jgi:hypothetical protein
VKGGGDVFKVGASEMNREWKYNIQRKEYNIKLILRKYCMM